MREVLDFLIRHGYVVIGSAVFAEQLGIPVPSMPVLLAAGAVAGNGALNPAACIIIAMTAAMLGDLFWFLLGRRYGGAVLGILCRISLEPDSCVERTESVYIKSGTWALVFAKFVPGLNTVMTPLAGRFHLATSRFLLFDGLGALLWATSYVVLGWLFRTQLERLADFFLRMGAGFGIVVVVSLAAYIGYRYWHRRVLYRELRMSRIAPWELKDRIDKGEDLLLIDLRNPVDRDEGVIPGSTLMSVRELLCDTPPVLFNSEVVLYCS